MRPHTYGSLGIVLTRIDFGEADRIISVYSKDFGKITLLAKGVRRPKSRKRGHIEAFNLIKFQAVTGRGLDILTEAEVVDDFKELRKSLNKVSLAYYFSEVVGRITHEHEKNHELFNLFLDYIVKIKSQKKLKNLRLEFILKLLTLLGYWPEGDKLLDPDKKLEEVIERQIFSERVGKRMLQ